ncbi:hypothetical protein GBA52_023492 [Prunus armeniaca]|nr:hypothetical protein GBA52_023492 [Prunus armeniaca]
MAFVISKAPPQQKQPSFSEAEKKDGHEELSEAQSSSITRTCLLEIISCCCHGQRCRSSTHSSPQELEQGQKCFSSSDGQLTGSFIYGLSGPDMAAPGGHFLFPLSL